jgi:transglutaminase-like putative cysteine protease
MVSSTLSPPWSIKQSIAVVSVPGGIRSPHDKINILIRFREGTMAESYEETMGDYLAPTSHIDSDSPEVASFATSRAGTSGSPLDRAVRLFYAVRDEIKYDPYHINISRESFTASAVLAKKSGFCIEKALLLAASARVIAVPSRLRFADVRNHLTTERLRKMMNTDLFIYHGYTELFLNDRWVKATPTFNESLCRRFGVKPIDFDGIHDAIFHEFDSRGTRHMEYVRDRGHYADLPYDDIIAAFKQYYPMYFDDTIVRSPSSFEEEASPDQ